MQAHPEDARVFTHVINPFPNKVGRTLLRAGPVAGFLGHMHNMISHPQFCRRPVTRSTIGRLHLLQKPHNMHE